MDQAAKATGLGSRKTAEKTIEVVHKIDELKAAGDVTTAAELADTLNNKSVKAAHDKATGKPAKEKKPKQNPGIYADLVAGIEWSLTQVVPRVQEVALRAEKMLGKNAGIFDVDAVKEAAKTIWTEFSRVERPARVEMEREKEEANHA